MKTICVASVQFQHVNGDRVSNYAKVDSFSRRGKEAGADLIVFPEMCLTGYWGLRDYSREDLLPLAETVPSGEYSRRIGALSDELEMVIGVGLIELSNDGLLYNTYLVAMPDGTFAHHRKLHAFINANVRSGVDYTVFDTPIGVRLGVLTCYDNNLVENARITALKGAEVILAPHQTGGCRSSDKHAMKPIDLELWHNRESDPDAIRAEFEGVKGRDWLMRWLPARAHDNGVFYVFSNGVGIDDDEVRTGNAMIIDPYGRILAETLEAADAMVVADLDAGLMENNTGQRWMTSRRPELYTTLTERTGREKDVRKSRIEENRNLQDWESRT